LEGPIVRRAGPMVLVRVRGKLRLTGGVLGLYGSFSGSNRCPEVLVLILVVLVLANSCKAEGLMP
jgi:hypothetical protein